MKVAFMGLMLAVQVLATATGAKAQTYGILWQNVTTGRFGVWQVSDHGTVRGAYDLTTPNPAYSRWPVPNRPNTYYYICGVSPDDPSGCSKTSTYSITELFPQRVGGFDFLFYNHEIGGMSPQLGDFSGSVTTPGRPLINLDRSAATCDAASGCSAAWKMVGTGTFDLSGLPSLLWYNAGTNQFGVWQISNIDVQTVVNYKSWPACDASCAAYGIPIGAADFNGDGITDILWFASDGSLTVFLQNGSGGYSTRAITQRVPFGFSLVGVRRESDVAIRLVWYNPFSGELQNWNLDIPTYDIRVGTLTWTCNGCFPDWHPVGLVPIQ